MRFEFRIAFRYFFSKSKQTIINRINIFALLVMSLATAALFIVLSAFTGLKDFGLSFTNAFDPDFEVTPQTGKSFSIDTLTLSKIEALPEVLAAVTEIEEKVFLSFDDKNKTAYLKGIGEEYTDVIPVDSLILLGNWISFENNVETVVGFGIASDMAIGTYDFENFLEITVPKKETSGAVFQQPFTTLPSYVVGLYQLSEDLDQKYVFATQPFVQMLLGLDSNEFSKILIKSETDISVATFKQKVEAIFPFPVRVKSRAELNAALYKMLNVEQLAVYFIFTLVMVIALFNVVGALIMIFLDKRGQMKILMSMGAEPQNLQRIFFYVGLLISFIGGVVGLFLGMGIVLLQGHAPFIFVPGTTLPYPVSFELKNALLVLITLLLLGTLTSLWTTRGMGKKVRLYQASA